MRQAFAIALLSLYASEQYRLHHLSITRIDNASAERNCLSMAHEHMDNFGHELEGCWC